MPPQTQTPKYLPQTTGPRLIVYAQTHHTPTGEHHSLLPLLTHQTGLTHLILAAIHLNSDPSAITLNDHHPSDPRFTTLWTEVQWLQGAGVKVLGMLGGAAKGSFTRLSGGIEEFEMYYSPLKALIQERRLDGLDLDVEEEVPLSTISRLIHRLRADFGSEFLITMAPVATALVPDPNHFPRVEPGGDMCPNPGLRTLPHLSGFSYVELECSEAGKEVAWYNTQFYCGWGDAGTTQWYDAIVAAGWAPNRVVLGVVTNPGNGSGFVGIEKLKDVCLELRGKYRGDGKAGFGGVMGWEYFNSGDCEDDIVHVSGLELNNETVQAGWVGALGRIVRVDEDELRRLDEDKLARLAELKSKKKPGLGYTPEQIRQMVTKLPEPRVEWPEESVSNLVVFGFSRQEAIAALNATEGNVDLAAGFLFDHQG